MTSRNGDTKQDAFSYAWSSTPGLEADVKEEAFAYSWSSLPGLDPKAEEKAFSYSWSSPVSDPSPPIPKQADATGAASSGADPAGVSDVQSAESSLGPLQGILGRVFEGGLGSIRNLGILGWSVVAGSGAIVAATEAGPSIAMRLGTIGGLWLAVSAAILVLPSKVLH
jgi:hypothetical protein